MNYIYQTTKNMIAGWSSLVARRAHNPEVGGSNPSPATIKNPSIRRVFLYDFYFYDTVLSF